MHILILGAAGMLGRKLTDQVIQDQSKSVDPVTLTLVDIIEPFPVNRPKNLVVQRRAMDICDPGAAREIIALQPDLIYQLAAVVSGEAEDNFAKGYAANFSANWNLLEAIRGIGQGYCPRFIFSSSLAVYGRPFPELVPDNHNLQPASSYGTQKALVEYLLADYSRKGHIDGFSLRLPTIVVRPGAPNAAASGFLSSMVREPLAGLPAVVPVADHCAFWLCSPKTAVANIHRAGLLSRDEIGGTRAMNLPGLTATVSEILDILKTVGGQKARNLVSRKPDTQIAEIVESWPFAFDTQTADALGFARDDSFDEIVQIYLDDMGVSA